MSEISLTGTDGVVVTFDPAVLEHEALIGFAIEFSVDHVDKTDDELRAALSVLAPTVAGDLGDLSALSKAALVAVAAERGVEIKKSWTSDKIIEAIDAAAGNPPVDDDPLPEHRARHEFVTIIDHVLCRFVPNQVIPEHLVARLLADEAPIDAVNS